MPKGKPHSDNPSDPNGNIETRSKTRAKASNVAEPPRRKCQRRKQLQRLRQAKSQQKHDKSIQTQSIRRKFNKIEQAKRGNPKGITKRVRFDCARRGQWGPGRALCKRGEFLTLTLRRRDIRTQSKRWERCVEQGPRNNKNGGKAWSAGTLCNNIQLIACEGWSNQCKSP